MTPSPEVPDFFRCFLDLESGKRLHKDGCRQVQTYIQCIILFCAATDNKRHKAVVFSEIIDILDTLYPLR